MNYITSRNNYLNLKERQFGKIIYDITKVATKIINSHYFRKRHVDNRFDVKTNTNFECVQFNRR